MSSATACAWVYVQHYTHIGFSISSYASTKSSNDFLLYLESGTSLSVHVSGPNVRLKIDIPVHTWVSFIQDP